MLIDYLKILIDLRESQLVYLSYINQIC